MNARAFFIAIALYAASALVAAAQPQADLLAWPEVTQTARPWTRWWWHGSAVDEANITRLLETYKAAGLGGVEITCIYGVKGAEDRVRPYLSDSWLAAVRHTLREAKRLGLGVDLPTGSGWRMGGPSVKFDTANAQLVLRSEAVAGGARFERDLVDVPLLAIMAYGSDGQVVDLKERIGGAGRLVWNVPAGNWTLYTVQQQWSRDNVKRPAPGGEGKNINPYSRPALDQYLAYFGAIIGDLPAEGIRAQFHDSFEYDGNWCDEFLPEFEKRRGYKLQEHLPALDGKGDPDEVARVKHDYRETLSDLVLDNLIKPWADWSHAHGMLARNQSHGSPANWLDLYGAVDIPETESFGRLVGGDGHPLLFKFASSAAHVMGRPLVSSETATWLDEHFHETLGQIKEMVDRQFLAGVNHVVFHGTAYSPQDAAWPGWVFYASTQLNPQNPIWRDLPALNEYVARCQSMLQSTKPDNDILLYWPIHDLWQNSNGLRMDFRVHNAKEWLLDTPFGKTAQQLDRIGYFIDFISDRQLAECRVIDGRIQTPGGSRYVAVEVPETKFMPLSTLAALSELSSRGAPISFDGGAPKGTPGWLATQGKSVAGQFQYKERSAITNIDQLSDYRVEECRSTLNLTRRSWPGGHVYFIKNENAKPFDHWTPLAVDWQSAALMDPMDGRAGVAATRADANGKIYAVRLQLAPGQTVFLKTFQSALPAGAPRWAYATPTGEATPVAGAWSVEFVSGGPKLPPATKIGKLESWTKFAGAEGERFAGTARYAIVFNAPAAGRYTLDLGKVADSARVVVNDKPVATLITVPFVTYVELREGENRLVVEVTNVAANRIRDLDRRRVPWKIFYDINVVDINYRPLDASRWPIREAGLLGPVTIQPLRNDPINAPR
ncbi:MAG: glycosyl hydrolase [Pirellulales bacterium]